MPSSVMNRPSAAYTLDVWRGVYASSTPTDGQRPALHTSVQLDTAAPAAKQTTNAPAT